MVPLYPNSRNRVFLGECVSERVGEWRVGELFINSQTRGRADSDVKLRLTFYDKNRHLI
jgi:hypothetical protein